MAEQNSISSALGNVLVQQLVIFMRSNHYGRCASRELYSMGTHTHIYRCRDVCTYLDQIFMLFIYLFRQLICLPGVKL